MKKKTRKKIMGYALLFILWIAMVAVMSVEMGIVNALVMWVICGGVAGLIMLALKWIVGD
jgi:hypothetical protein